MVVLISGSMRMAVEEVRDDRVKVVWCHEGRVGRDEFDARLLNKWEAREGQGAGPRPFGGKPQGDRGGKPWQNRDERPRGGDDRPPRKTGWDGKPRDKKYFRKED